MRNYIVPALLTALALTLPAPAQLTGGIGTGATPMPPADGSAAKPPSGTATTPPVPPPPAPATAPALPLPPVKPPAPGVRPAVSGLTLPDPQTVPAGSGYLKLTAVAKTPVKFDCFAVFSDPEAQALFHFEAISDTAIIVGIPGSAGAIRVTAATVLDGKPSDIASTVIQVAAPKGEAGADAASGGAAASTPAVLGAVKLDITVVGGTLPPALADSLKAAGHSVWVYAAEDVRLAARPDIAEAVKRVGGGAAVILSAGGRGLAAEPVPKRGEDFIALVNKYAGGK